VVFSKLAWGLSDPFRSGPWPFFGEGFVERKSDEE